MEALFARFFFRFQRCDSNLQWSVWTVGYTACLWKYCSLLFVSRSLCSCQRVSYWEFQPSLWEIRVCEKLSCQLQIHLAFGVKHRRKIWVLGAGGADHIAWQRMILFETSWKSAWQECARSSGLRVAFDSCGAKAPCRRAPITTAKNSNKCSKESPCISNTPSQESPTFQKGLTWVNGVPVTQKRIQENWIIWRSKYFKSDLLCEWPTNN